MTALVMPDGRYAVTISETRPGEVFASKSPDGPWESLGKITVAGPAQVARVERDADAPARRAVHDRAALGADHDQQGDRRALHGPGAVDLPDVKGLPQKNLEDPVAWYSGGLYHIVVNSWSDAQGVHLTSEDGLTNWTFRGLAYDPTTDFLRYTDGTVNHWEKIERPAVFLENGHVTHFTFAVIDVPKEQDKGNDRHGSKVIVVPFDGAAMDRDLAELAKREKSGGANGAGG